MKVNGHIKDGKIVFSSKRSELKFLEENEGADIIIATDDGPTSGLRRYFEGCVVPIVFYTVIRSDWNTFKDAREAVKHAFLPVHAVATLRGFGSVKICPSTSDMSKKQFQAFVDSVCAWLLDNKLCTPEDLDAEAYKAWRDSAPAGEEIYPPFVRMKDDYLQKKEIAVPPWKR